MGTFYAIGGGNFEKETNLLIDKKIISDTGKVNPKLLYIPAASNDRIDAIITVRKYFEKLGCIVDVLYINEMLKAKEKFVENDILYFGGGMTKRLVDIAIKYNLKELIVEAYRSGKIIAGISAGAIMLFDYGYGDQFAYAYHGEVKGYRYVEGLGILKGIFVPHYQSVGLLAFHDEVSRYSLDSFALEDMTALKITDNGYQIIKEKNMGIKFDSKQNYLLIPLKKDYLYEEKIIKGGDYQ